MEITNQNLAICGQMTARHTIKLTRTWCLLKG